jgi:hypothetical protein
MTALVCALLFLGMVPRDLNTSSRPDDPTTESAGSGNDLAGHATQVSSATKTEPAPSGGRNDSRISQAAPQEAATDAGSKQQSAQVQLPGSTDALDSTVAARSDPTSLHHDSNATGETGIKAHDRIRSPASAVPLIFGESIETRLLRFKDAPAFPFAAEITAPLTPLFQPMEELPLVNDDVVAILDDAFRLHAMGEPLAGEFGDPDRDIDLHWTVERMDGIEAADAERLDQLRQAYSIQYELYLSGWADGRVLDHTRLAVLRTNELGTRSHFEFYQPDGTLYTIGSRSHPSRAEFVETLHALWESQSQSRVLAGAGR